MSYLITGSSGFIGTNFCKFLLDKKIKFIAVDKRKNRYINLKNFFKIDLRNFNNLHSVAKKNKITKIIHLAALPGLKLCHDNPEKAFIENVYITFNILRLSNHLKIKKVFIASSFAVDQFYKNPSIYSCTKKICEDFAYSYNKNLKKNISILKFSNVFGPYSAHKISAVHNFIRNSIQEKSLKIHGDGKQTRDFIFVEDLIKKIFSIINSPKSSFKYSINTGKKISINRVLNLIDVISKKSNKKKYISTPPGYISNRGKEVYSNKFLKKFEFFLKKTFIWYKANLNI
jgi:nucleoside-diphosphate-sugar epimerase